MKLKILKPSINYQLAKRRKNNNKNKRKQTKILHTKHAYQLTLNLKSLRCLYLFNPHLSDSEKQKSSNFHIKKLIKFPKFNK